MLERSIEARDWPAALSGAIELWRDTRDPVVAQLVDRIAVRCEPVPPPADWATDATHYDPIRVTTLLDHLPVRLRASDASWESIAERWPHTAVGQLVATASRWDSSTNSLERYAAMEGWPDDPRLAPVLVHWLVGHVRFVGAELYARFMQLLADRLADLRDVRILPRLRAHAPASALLEALDRVEYKPAGVEPLLRLLAAPTQLEGLWKRASLDREARGVLADALVEIGDPRGTFIARQLAGDRAETLQRNQWERWLGPDLGAIAVRDGTEFRGGMIEILRVGHSFTPSFAWTAVIGHRELRTVHTVRIGYIDDRRAFAEFAAELPSLQRIEILEFPRRLDLRALIEAISCDAEIVIARTIPDATEVAADCTRVTLV